MMKPSPQNTAKRCALRRWIMLFAGLVTLLSAFSGLIVGVAMREARSQAYRDTQNAANLAASQYDLLRETISYYVASVELILLEHHPSTSEAQRDLEELSRPQ